MHELSLCQGMLRQVRNIAAENGASAVDRIVLSVGTLSGVEPPLLQRAFSIARLDTIAANAVLDIRTNPVRVRCRNCEKESEVDGYRLLCSHCQSWQVNVITGEELLLLRVELSGISETTEDRETDTQATQGREAHLEEQKHV
jgi:hydrogenase nickel incorporation protein HypA/HybF